MTHPPPQGKLKWWMQSPMKLILRAYYKLGSKGCSTAERKEEVVSRWIILYTL